MDYRDISLQLQDHALMLIGKHPRNWFTHVLHMPTNSKPEEAKATWNDGILIVNIPRMKKYNIY